LRHVEKCPACQARLIGREDARRWLVQADQIGGLDGLWPAIRKAMDAGPAPRAVAQGGAAFLASSPPSRPKLRFLRWAAATSGLGGAALAILTILALVVPRGVDFAGAADPQHDSLRIVSASVAGQPAETYIIEIPENRMILVWIEPRSEKGGQP
jgi:hypothetical protein